MKRVLAFLTALALLTALCPAALAQSGFSPRLAVVSGTDPTSTDKLTLRLNPYDTSPSVARLFVGTYVRVVGLSGSWAEVEVGGGDTTMLIGYVPRRCVDETLQTVCQLTPTLKVNNTTGGEGIILRSEASKISKALGLFPNGSTVTGLAMMPEGWYFVQAGGLTGYAAEYGFDNALGSYNDAPAVVGKLANDWESNQFDTLSAYCAVRETSAGYFDFTCTVDFKPSVLTDTIVGIYVYANRELVCMLPAVDVHAVVGAHCEPPDVLRVLSAVGDRPVRHGGGAAVPRRGGAHGGRAGARERLPLELIASLYKKSRG